MLNGKHKSEILLGVIRRTCLCPVRTGVLISTRESTIELWDNDLCACIKTWINLPGVEQAIPLSEQQVAVIRPCEVKVLDTSSGEFVSTVPVFNGRVLACNSKWQLVTISDSRDTLQLLDGTTVVWKKEEVERVKKSIVVHAVFSPTEQLLLVSAVGLLFLDAKTGHTLRTFPPLSLFCQCNFISDKECVISRYDLTVQLFDIESGKVVSAIDVESKVTCLGVCPFNRRLIAIALKSAMPIFIVIRVHSPRDEYSKSKRR